MSSTATASRSISRTTVGAPSWFACSRSRSRVSSVTGSVSGTSPVCWHEHQVPQVLEQVGDEPPEILALLRELLEEHERAGRVALDDEVAEAEQHLLLDRAEQLQHVLHRDRAARRGDTWSSVDTASRNEPRAARAMSASAASGTSIPSPSAMRRSSFTRSGRRGRWKTNVWQRERTVGSTFCSSVVQNTNRRCGGGSSISFSSAFHAASVSWCASSRM
jgi:hypothetical protein